MILIGLLTIAALAGVLDKPAEKLSSEGRDMDRENNDGGSELIRGNVEVDLVLDAFFSSVSRRHIF